MFGQTGGFGSTGGGFGQQPQQGQQTGGLFGQTSTGFGQPQQQSTCYFRVFRACDSRTQSYLDLARTAGGMFGQTQQPGQTGGLFGQPAQPAQQQSTGLFGGSTPAQSNAFGKSEDHLLARLSRLRPGILIHCAPGHAINQVLPEELSVAVRRALLVSNNNRGLLSEPAVLQEEVYLAAPLLEVSLPVCMPSSLNLPLKPLPYRLLIARIDFRWVYRVRRCEQCRSCDRGWTFRIDLDRVRSQACYDRIRSSRRFYGEHGWTIRC